MNIIPSVHICVTLRQSINVKSWFWSVRPRWLSGVNLRTLSRPVIALTTKLTLAGRYRSVIGFTFMGKSVTVHYIS